MSDKTKQRIFRELKETYWDRHAIFNMLLVNKDESIIQFSTTIVGPEGYFIINLLLYYILSIRIIYLI